MRNLTRRESVTLFSSLICMVSGCVSNPPSTPPNSTASSSSPDIDIQNCSSTSIRVSLQIESLHEMSLIYDKTHKVPMNYCGHLSKTIQIFNVFSEPGEYEVRVTVPKVGSNHEVFNIDQDSIDGRPKRTIYIDVQAAEIYLD